MDEQGDGDYLDIPFDLPPPKKRHPCFNWCGQRLIGIAQAGARQGELPEIARFRMTCRRPRKPGPECHTFRCQHQRDYFIEPVD
jgi:hypothetical protein